MSVGALVRSPRPPGNGIAMAQASSAAGGTRAVGNIEVSLQEFDHIETRPTAIAIFKHVATMRYLNRAERNKGVVWCDYQTDIGSERFF